METYATCNGKMSSVNNKVGGHCYGTANGGFMKIEMHVCKDEDTACLENVGKPHCQEEPSSSHVLNTETVPHTAAVSSYTQSPTEGKTNPCKEVLNLLVKKGATDSESEDKCKIWKIAVACSSGISIAAFFCLCCKCFCPLNSSQNSTQEKANEAPGSV
ncbi:uncharacterized protein [Pocillopora verrucosa]|uniref:uncharacterized protein isoform X3 n=1 Tax=Pocillopora verrucosa TaxID=203993 RepID=UPI00333E1D92